MANEKNLVPFDERTESEQREIASAGGKASGAARRRKKSMKQKMQLLLSLPAADNDQTELATMGVDPDDMDNEMVLVKALFLAAAEGDTRAFDRIQDVLGRSVAREELALKKQRRLCACPAPLPSDQEADPSGKPVPFRENAGIPSLLPGGSQNRRQTPQ